MTVVTCVQSAFETWRSWSRAHTRDPAKVVESPAGLWFRKPTNAAVRTKMWCFG